MPFASPPVGDYAMHMRFGTTGNNAFLACNVAILDSSEKWMPCTMHSVRSPTTLCISICICIVVGEDASSGVHASVKEIIKCMHGGE
jgi:hypothetical protein